MGAGFSWVDGLLVEDRNQAAESNTDQECQQSSKVGIRWERPAEEEGAEVDQKEHQSGSRISPAVSAKISKLIFTHELTEGFSESFFFVPNSPD